MLTFKETKKIIKDLKKHQSLGSSPDKFTHKIKQLISGVELRVQTHKNDLIYRGRWNENDLLYDSIDDLKYPPKHVVGKKGRLNNIEESIFYGSICMLGSIVELRPDINKLFTISTIECINKQILYMPLGMIPIYNNFNIQQKIVTKYLNKEMIKKVTNDDEYNLTIALSNCIIGAEINTNITNFNRNLCIAYPSVESKKITNTTTYNVAMKPSTFDNNFKIVKAEVCFIVNRNSHYEILILNKTKEIIDKELIWDYDSNEMNQRIQNGLDIKNKYSKDIQDYSLSLNL